MAYAILILFVASMALMVNWAAAKRLFLVVLLAGALRMGYGHGSTGQTEWTSRSRSPER